jgi:hypothetical protein
MSMFRSKKLDLGCFINIKVIRDHTKRKVFAEHETQRYVFNLLPPTTSHPPFPAPSHCCRTIEERGKISIANTH